MIIKKTLVIDDRWPAPARGVVGLVQQLLKVSKHQAEQIIHDGGVRVNRQSVRRTGVMLQLGDCLEVGYDPDDYLPPPPKTADAPTPLEIVFEDEHLVVVNKPPGLLTVPTPRREAKTLISQLTRRLRRKGTGDEAFCVHRLDRGVSGLLVFGKRLEIAAALRDQFEARKPARQYVAIVAGRVQRREGTFRSLLATDKKTLSRYSTDDPSIGELAITHYQVQSQLRDATIVEVWLETGRRNQIRVHFAEAGHPVLGDTRYGRGVDQQLQRPWTHRRLALHAESLGFTHPVTNRPLEFHSPLPFEMLDYAHGG